MDATVDQITNKIGSFQPKKCGKGRIINEEMEDLMLTGDDSVVGKYVGLSYDN